MRRPVVFITDFGRDDAYAAALIGAAWRVDPQAICVEGTHGVPPADILAGAYHLKSLAIAFERRVVFCAVVDPGVGTERRAIAVEVGSSVCVAPDNGLISYLWTEASADERRAVQLDVPVDASPTFHGRDVFAPAAAQLATGTDLEDVGAPVGDPVVLAEVTPWAIGANLSGVVAVIDHFGNAITTVRDVDIGARTITGATWPGGATTRVVRTYGEIQPGLALLIGSSGHVEVAARGSAATGGPALHDAVTITLA